MSKTYSCISSKQEDFIEQQHIYFVATAAKQGRVNLSPKGMDSLRVINDWRIIWLNVTGSSNETSAHLLLSNRMTLMFCSFSCQPMILRLYGRATEITPKDGQWNTLYSLFNPLPGCRHIFNLEVELVQTSCGTAVPLFDYVGDRDQLNKWAEKKGKEGIWQYWQDKNGLSLDGYPTKIVSK